MNFDRKRFKPGQVVNCCYDVLRGFVPVGRSRVSSQTISVRGTCTNHMTTLRVVELLRSLPLHFVWYSAGYHSTRAYIFQLGQAVTHGKRLYGSSLYSYSIVQIGTVKLRQVFMTLRT